MTEAQGHAPLTCRVGLRRSRTTSLRQIPGPCKASVSFAAHRGQLHRTVSTGPSFLCARVELGHEPHHTPDTAEGLKARERRRWTSRAGAGNRESL